METIAQEITRLQGAKADLKTAIEAKGVTVPSATKIDGYATLVGQIQQGSTPNLQTLNVTPSTSAQQITPTSPVDGYDEVNVAAVTAAIDQNIVAGNIKKDVEILGVTGTYEGANVDPNPVAEDNDVIFIDYDGVIRYSYTRAEFLELTELPPNPVHDGLTAQGWNWTLSDAQAVVRDCIFLVIGQNYITDDGKTRLYFRLDKDVDMPVSITFNGTDMEVDVDWGEGGAVETITSTGSATVATNTHTYSGAGEHIVTIDVKSGTVYLGGEYGSQTDIFGGKNKTYPEKCIPSRYLYKLELGAGLSPVIGYVLFNSEGEECNGIKYLTCPNYAKFEYCGGIQRTKFLETIIIGPSAGNINRSLPFANYVSLPKESGTTKDRGHSSRSPYFKGVSTNLYLDDMYITKVAIPSQITSFSGSYSFANAWNLRLMVCTPTTPPTGAISINDYCKIYVPYSSDHSILNAYKAATNWVAHASQIYELDANGNIPTS